MRLEEPTSGKLTFDGIDVYSQKGAPMRTLRRDIQIVFQDPYYITDSAHDRRRHRRRTVRIHTDVAP